MARTVDTHGNVNGKILIAAAALALGAQAPILLGQEIYVPEPEAPTTIFQTKLGDAEIDLNLQGSWDAGLGFGFGLLFAPGLPVQLLDSFPSMSVGFYFRQVPNLTASAVLFDSYFLDLSVKQDPITQGLGGNTLVFGYRGEPPGLLRSLIFGNGGVEIPSSDFMQIPAQPASSLGVSALLASGVSANELLVRWDSAEEKSKTFFGTSELLEETAALDSYMRGRFFFLPDYAVDPESLAVYIEDPQHGSIAADDGKIYRKAGIEDVSPDAGDGTVSLKSAVKGRVLVFYRKGGFAVGDSGLTDARLPGELALPPRRDLSAPSIPFAFQPAVTPDPYLGRDMEFRRIALPGVGDCLLLWEPGDSSPFEMDNSYAFENLPPEDPARIQISLEAKQSGVSLPDLHFRALPAEKRFEVYATDGFRSDYRNMYPFPDPDGLLYGPLRESLSGSLPYRIKVRLLNPGNQIVLEPGIVAGSVRVSINGIPETRFQVDTQTGRLTFQIGIHDTDRIDVYYRVSSSGLSGGDVLFAWRDTMTFSDALILTLAAGVRWNADPWSFSRKAYSKSGTVMAQAGLQGSGDTWSYSVQAGLAFTNPDTSGLLRLFGMEGNSLNIDLAEEYAYPAAPPTGYAQANRGYLYYKDFRSYDVFGGAALHALSWPDFLPGSYANGGKMGPYGVLGSPSGAGTGSSLVLDFALTAGQWAGSQLPVIPGGSADLSSAESFTLQYRAIDVTGTFDIVIEVGSLAEDIDGNGALNAESSSTDAGFAFSDLAHAITLRVGGGPRGEGNSVLDSEDRNVNGILDAEKAGEIITESIPVLGNVDAWQTARFDLTSEERSYLMDARQVRIAVASAAGAQGKLIIGGFSFEGAAEHASVSVSGGAYGVREISENLSAYDPGPGSRLQDVFSAVGALHPSGEAQEILEAEWGALSSPLVITGYTDAGTGGIRYGKVGLFFRIPAALAGAVAFSLEDAGGRGIFWTVDAAALSRIAAGPWHEMTVSAADGLVRVDGADIGVSVPPVFDSGYGSLLKLTVKVSDASGTGAPPPGALMLDEIRCMEPEGAFGAALTAEGSIEIPKVWEAGGFKIVSDLSLRQKVTLISPGFSTLYGIPSAAEDLYTKTELGADVLYSRIGLGMVLREHASAMSASGSHSITVPSVDFPLKVTDSFSLNEAGEFSREDAVEIGPLGPARIGLRTKSDATTAVLTQAWSGRASFTPVSSLSISSEADLRQGLSGFSLPSLWYGENWIRQMALVMPWDGGQAISRREKLIFSADLVPAPFGFQASAEAGALATGYTAAAFAQENALDMSIKLLLRLGAAAPDIVTFSVGYGRSVRLNTAEETGAPFWAECGSYAGIIGSQAYLLTAIPYAELFQAGIADLAPAWADASKASYEPKATFSIQRGYGSRLWDLFVPSSVDVSMARRAKKDGNLSSTELTIAPRLANHALNLFGQLGSTPLFSFARTDEYGLSMAASIVSGDLSTFRLEGMTVDLYASLEGFNEDSLTLTHSFQWAQEESVNMSDTTRLELDWTFRPKGGLQIPLLSKELAESAFLSNGEAVEAVFRYTDASAYHACTAVLEHSTSLVFPKNGSIKAKARLGYDLEDLLTGSFASRIGVIFELEAKLTF